ncbi:MAG: hypothetical protein U0270_09735 [Labilithrix sp.]
MSVDTEIAAGLCLSRLLTPEEAARRTGPWIVATMTERLELPPAGVIADVGALLFGATLEKLRPASDDPQLAGAVRRYEDALLGRLANDRRILAAGFAALRLPEAMHPQAVGILVAGILARIGLEGGVQASPAIVRRLTGRRPDEALAAGYAALREDEDLRRALAERYSDLARAAQRARDLVGDADIFALENLAVLGALGQRLAVSDVLHAQESLLRGIPKRVQRRRKKEGDVAAKLDDESAYPAGGFSSMSTSGTIENLVTSELIYMDPPGSKTAGAIDLFDMRWVEGELLYYTRDEAILVRRRRLVIMALDPDLARARVKDAHLPWQRIVLVLATVMVLTKKLVELLGEEALELRVVFLGDELAEEQALAELLLGEWRDKGMCEVTTSSWPALVTDATENTRRALVEIVHLGATTPDDVDPRLVLVDFPLPTGTVEDWTRRITETLASLL